MLRGMLGGILVWLVISLACMFFARRWRTEHPRRVIYVWAWAIMSVVLALNVLGMALGW